MTTKTSTRSTKSTTTTDATPFVPTPDEATVEAYRAADQSGKAKIRASVQKSMVDATMALDGETAANWAATLGALTAKSSSPKVEIDPKQVIAQRVADLEHAVRLLRTGTVPTDLTHEWAESDFVGGFVTLPDVEADAENATKIASQKLTRTDARRSIDGAVERAFEGLDSGSFLTVAEIRTRSLVGGPEGYVPSDGAIAARLFPRNGGDCTLVGVVPTEADIPAGTPRGATKTDD